MSKKLKELPVGLKYGNLFWLSDHFKRWKEVYLVLHQNEIHIYTPKTDEMKLTTKVLVAGCSVVETEARDSKKPFLFKMTHPQLPSEIVFAASSKEELEEWISAIRAVVNLTYIPESRLKVTHENNTLFKEFNAIVMMVDQIIQLLPTVFKVNVAEETVTETSRFRLRSPRKNVPAFSSPPCMPTTASPSLLPSFPPLTRSASFSAAMSPMSSGSVALPVTVSSSQTNGFIYGRNFLHWAQDLGSSALKIAAAAQAVSFRNISTAIKTMSNNIVGLVNVLHDMRKDLLKKDLSNELVVMDLQSVSTTLVSICSETVIKISREDTIPEQIQMRILLSLGLIWEISTAAATSPSSEKVVTLRDHITQIRSMSISLSQRIGNDLVLFSSACIPLLTEDFITASVSSNFLLAEAALSNALTKLSGLVRSAAATRTLRDAIEDLRQVIVDIGEVKEIESIHSLGPLAQAFIEQMTELIKRAFGYDHEGFAGIAEALGSVGDQVLWGCHAVSDLIKEESGAKGNYDRVSNEVVTLITQLRDDLWIHIQKLGKDQTVAIKISCSAFQVCEAFYKLLRTSLSVQRFMKRKGTLFDEDEEEEETVVPVPEDGESDVLEDAEEDEGEEEEEENKENNEDKKNKDDEEDDNIVEDEDEDDCDVWKEPPDSSANIMLDTDGKLKAGNLNKLIERLTMASEQDITFQKTFVTTYRSFTTPEAFFRKLRQRFNMDIPHLPPSVSPSEYRKLFILPVQLRVINVMRQWIDTSIFDMDDALIERIRAFISTELDQDTFRGFSRQLGDLLTRKIEERRTAVEAEMSERAIVEDAAAKVVPEEKKIEEPIAPENGDAPESTTPFEDPDFIEGCIVKNEAAEDGGRSTVETPSTQNGERKIMPVSRERSRTFQSTVHIKTLSTFTFMTMGTEVSMDKELPMPMVHDEDVISAECLKIFQFTSEEIAEQMTFLDFHYYRMIRPVELLNKSWSKYNGERSPNVTTLIRRFNEVSRWAATLILAQKTAAARAVMWSRFVVIGDALLRLNNFNSLLAILSVFNVSSINRLRETKRLLPNPMSKWIEAQMKLMNSAGSYHNYRESIRMVDPPLVPYLGVYLTDLTFIEDGNQNFLDGLINFKKRQMVYKIIADIQLYQQDKYDISPNPNILSFLSKLDFKDENDLYKLSLIREPRINTSVN